MALRKVLETATQEAPTSKQVEAAKNEALNSFVFNFASSSSQLSRLLIYELLGLPQVMIAACVRAWLYVYMYLCMWLHVIFLCIIVFTRIRVCNVTLAQQTISQPLLS